MKGVEWGSGRSTIWWAKRVGALHSIEHDWAWFSAVKGKIAESGLRNIEYEFVELDHDPKEPCVPVYPKTPRYVATGERHADDSLHFAVVDGHYRQACVLMAVRKLAPGGYLLVDNTNWLPMERWGVPVDFDLLLQATYDRGETCLWRKP